MKTVDPAIVEVEILEYLQRLKLYGISLERYLSKEKMEILKQEVKSLINIQLKTLSQWLISEDRFREVQTTGNKPRSAILIMVKGETKVKRLFISSLRFDGLMKMVKKF